MLAETMHKEVSTQKETDEKLNIELRKKKAEYNKKYRQKHRDELLEHNRKYYQEHKDKLREDAKRYYQDHREEVREYRRKYRQEHKEKFKDYQKNYFQKNREKFRESARRGHLKDLEHYRRFKIEFGGKCVVCGESDLNVLEVHHPDRRVEEKGVSFVQTKEFKRWVNDGIKPRVVLLCSNHHQKLEIAIAHGEPDWTKTLI